jgi:hypothetical protein
MGRYAQWSCGYQGQIVLEQESRTMWENVQNAIPLIQDVDRIKIVSHPIHAYKTRACLHRHRPDLAAACAGSSPGTPPRPGSRARSAPTGSATSCSHG